MKKISLMLIAAFTVATGLVSCSGNKSNRDGDSAGKAADTTVQTDTAAAVEAEETTTVSEFMSDDLKAQGLRGQVKKVTPKTYSPDEFLDAYCAELTFNDKGKNTTQFFDDYSGKRNADGIDTKMYTRYGTDGTQADIEYLELNEYGHPLKAKYDLDGPIDGINGTLTFSDYKYDEHQNWISRKVSAAYKFTELETDAVSNRTKTWTETRTITYY